MLLKDIDVEDIILCPDLLDEITFVKVVDGLEMKLGQVIKTHIFCPFL